MCVWLMCLYKCMYGCGCDRRGWFVLHMCMYTHVLRTHLLTSHITHHPISIYTHQRQSVLCFTMDAWGGKTAHFAHEYDTTSLLGPLERGIIIYFIYTYMYILNIYIYTHITTPSIIHHSQHPQAPAAGPPRAPARGAGQARRPPREQGTYKHNTHIL
jgi:hypothetical protein